MVGLLIGDGIKSVNEAAAIHRVGLLSWPGTKETMPISASPRRTSIATPRCPPRREIEEPWSGLTTCVVATIAAITTIVVSTASSIVASTPVVVTTITFVSAVSAVVSALIAAVVSSVPAVVAAVTA